jgi:pimeloyl-ACP methyl ester carboxylesterase
MTPLPTPALQRLAGVALLAMASALALAQPQLRTLELSDGDVLQYALWLPDDFDGDRSYPVLMALPPGPQTLGMVQAGLGTWQTGPARGWVVVSPVAPGGRLFFQGSEVHIPALLDAVADEVEIEGVHLGGISNGGRSAFRIARLDPDRYTSLVALPGYPPERADSDALDLLTGLPVRMFVGENDGGWVQRSQDAADRLRELGGDVELTVVPNEGHVIRSLTGRELFDLLDSLR